MECFYLDICEMTGFKCEFLSQSDCGKYIDWKQLDLELLFKQQIDYNGNYLFDFYPNKVYRRRRL